MRLSETFTPANHDKISELEEKVAKLTEQLLDQIRINTLLAGLLPDKEKAAEIRKIVERQIKAPTTSKPTTE
jgi:hypothetical protein